MVRLLLFVLAWRGFCLQPKPQATLDSQGLLQTNASLLKWDLPKSLIFTDFLLWQKAGQVFVQVRDASGNLNALGLTLEQAINGEFALGGGFAKFKVEKEDHSQPYTLAANGVQWFHFRGEVPQTRVIADELIQGGHLHQIESSSNVKKFQPIFEAALKQGADEVIRKYVKTLGMKGTGQILGAWDSMFETAQKTMTDDQYVPRYRVDTAPETAQQQLTPTPAHLMTKWQWFWSWFGYTYYDGSIAPLSKQDIPSKAEKTTDKTNLAAANLHHDWSNPIVPAIYEDQFKQLDADPKRVHIFNLWAALTDVEATPLGFVKADPNLNQIITDLAKQKKKNPNYDINTCWIFTLRDWLQNIHAGQTIIFSNMKQGDFLVFDTLKKVHGALPLAKNENFRASVEFRVVYVE